MIVYLDLLFLFNFIINFIFLIVIEIIYKSKYKLWKILLGSAIGGIIVIVSLFDYIVYDVLKITGGIIIAYIGLENCKGFRSVVKYSSFYILNLASVGLVNAFGINTHIMLFFGLASIIAIYFVESNKKLIIFSNRLKYNIIVEFKKTSLNLEGFLDTGNLSEFNDLPIIYISEKHYSKDLVNEPSFLVEVSTLNSTNYLEAYKPNKCFLKVDNQIKEVNVLVVFCNISIYECLLNLKMFI